MEILALAGVDLVIIDNEHYPFNPQTLIDLVRAADVHGMATCVRVPNCEPTRIAQIMDMGVDGIMVPSVDSYEEAMQLVNAVKYPPLGTRGFCPITRAASYGMKMKPDEFAAFSNEKSFVIVQIETKSGVADLEKILSIPDVDVIEYGPSDLAASYGMPGHNDDPQIQTIVNEIISKALSAGKDVPYMVHSPEAAIEALEKGFTHISLGSDQQMITAGIRALVGEVKK